MHKKRGIFQVPKTFRCLLNTLREAASPPLSPLPLPAHRCLLPHPREDLGSPGAPSRGAQLPLPPAGRPRSHFLLLAAGRGGPGRGRGAGRSSGTGRDGTGRAGGGAGLAGGPGGLSSSAEPPRRDAEEPGAPAAGAGRLPRLAGAGRLLLAEQPQARWVRCGGRWVSRGGPQAYIFPYLPPSAPRSRGSGLLPLNCAPRGGERCGQGRSKI